MITMYDGVDPLKIPVDAPAVAGYVDGLYAWPDSGWARFSTRFKLQIAVFSTTIADILDVEQGNDMNPADWVSWVLLVRAHGRTPIMYMNTSTWAQVRYAFLSRGVSEPLYWVAQYDGVPTIPTGAAGKQYLNNSAAGYDLSVVEATVFGPSPAQPTVSTRRNDMHADLKLNEPVVFTNPAAVLGGASRLLLASDFGTAEVRVATYSFSTKTWTINNYTVGAEGGAVSLELPSDTNKASVEATSYSTEPCPVGLDVFA